MESLTIQGRDSAEMTLDVCFTCQGIWFDRHESQQMPASGVLELFRLIHNRSKALSRPWSRELHCPRCATDLTTTLDLCKNGKFSYFHCPNQHGRFTAFAAFLIEKGFVRQLTAQEIRTLPVDVTSVKCSSCGAPIDIRKESVCAFCHMPVVVLDHQAVEKALNALQASAQQQHGADKNAVIDALLMSERQRWVQEMQNGVGANRSWWYSHEDNAVSQGIDLFWGFLHR